MLVLVALLVVLVGGFFIYEKFGITQQAPVAIINNNTGGNNSQPQPAPTTTVPATTTGFKDGTYIGNETSSMYGKAKVQVVITGGKITDVQFLEYPNDRPATLRKAIWLCQ